MNERLEEDAAKIRGLVFVSDGSRGADKVAEGLRQRDQYSTALQSILDVLDHYSVPSKWNDPTGEILTAMEGMERVIRRSITDALEDRA